MGRGRGPPDAARAQGARAQDLPHAAVAGQGPREAPDRLRQHAPWTVSGRRSKRRSSPSPTTSARARRRRRTSSTPLSIGMLQSVAPFRDAVRQVHLRWDSRPAPRTAHRVVRGRHQLGSLGAAGRRAHRRVVPAPLRPRRSSTTRRTTGSTTCARRSWSIRWGSTWWTASASIESMWSTDFPHNESTYGYSRQSLRSVVDAVGAESAPAIVGGNIMRYLGWTLTAAGRARAHRDPSRCRRYRLGEATPEPQGAPDVTADDIPPPEEIILYEKDPSTRIATITLNRPDRLNSPTIGASQPLRRPPLQGEHRRRRQGSRRARQSGTTWGRAPTSTS